VAFEFEEKHDYGFSRYLLPGKAHIDYWGDAKVFGHFIDDVVRPTAGMQSDPSGSAVNSNLPVPVAPKSSPWVSMLSLAIPYFLTFLIHAAAIFLVYKGIQGLDTSASNATKEVSSNTRALGDKLEETVQLVLSVSILLMGTTAAARLPRLTKGGRWIPVAVGCLVLAAACVFKWLPDSTAVFAAAVVDNVPTGTLQPVLVGKIVVVLGAVVIALVGWCTPRKPRIGRTWVIGAGVVILLLIVAKGVHELPAATRIWPTLLSAAGFLYLWWLGILLFDLTFVWHRYIRQSVAIETLNAWRNGIDAQPRIRLNSQRRAVRPRSKKPDQSDPSQLPEEGASVK